MNYEVLLKTGDETCIELRLPKNQEAGEKMVIGESRKYGMMDEHV